MYILSGMNGKYRNSNIIFHPFRGLGKLCFSFEEKEVISVMGQPAEREIYYYNNPANPDAGDDPGEPLQFTINMYYSNMAIFIGYSGDKFQGTSVHLDDLIIDGYHLSGMHKEDALDLLENYHSRNTLRFKCHTSYAEVFNEECYEYDNLGLTIWYEGDAISNICVMAPNAWEM